MALRTAAVAGSGCPQGLETLANLGESELIRRLGAFAPAGQFADDAALLSAGGEGALVVNTDVLV
ncbi:MAG: thiamine-monophosphate kinase, partial [Cyanobium sp.]